MAYHGSTSTSFKLASGNGNDVITDYVNSQLRKAHLRGNVNVVPVYACANTQNGARPSASTTGARAVNLVVWPIMPQLHFLFSRRSPAVRSVHLRSQISRITACVQF